MLLKEDLLKLLAALRESQNSHQLVILGDMFQQRTAAFNELMGRLPPLTHMVKEIVSSAKDSGTVVPSCVATAYDNDRLQMRDKMQEVCAECNAILGNAMMSMPSGTAPAEKPRVEDSGLDEVVRKQVEEVRKDREDLQRRMEGIQKWTKEKFDDDEDGPGFERDDEDLGHLIYDID